MSDEQSTLRKFWRSFWKPNTVPSPSTVFNGARTLPEPSGEPACPTPPEVHSSSNDNGGSTDCHSISGASHVSSDVGVPSSSQPKVVCILDNGVAVSGCNNQNHYAIVNPSAEEVEPEEPASESEEEPSDYSETDSEFTDSDPVEYLEDDEDEEELEMLEDYSSSDDESWCPAEETALVPSTRITRSSVPVAPVLTSMVLAPVQPKISNEEALVINQRLSQTSASSERCLQKTELISPESMKFDVKLNDGKNGKANSYTMNTLLKLIQAEENAAQIVLSGPNLAIQTPGRRDPGEYRRELRGDFKAQTTETEGSKKLATAYTAFQKASSSFRTVVENVAMDNYFAIRYDTVLREQINKKDTRLKRVRDEDIQRIDEEAQELERKRQKIISQ